MCGRRLRCVAIRRGRGAFPSDFGWSPQGRRVDEEEKVFVRGEGGVEEPDRLTSGCSRQWLQEQQFGGGGGGMAERRRAAAMYGRGDVRTELVQARGAVLKVRAAGKDRSVFE